MVVAQALKEELEPTMRCDLDRLVDALPTKLDFNFDFSVKENAASKNGNSSSGDFYWTALTSNLTPFTAKFTGPVGSGR